MYALPLAHASPAYAQWVLENTIKIALSAGWISVLTIFIHEFTVFGFAHRLWAKPVVCLYWCAADFESAGHGPPVCGPGARLSDQGRVMLAHRIGKNVAILLAVTMLTGSYVLRFFAFLPRALPG